MPTHITTRRVSAGVVPEPGSTSQRPAWWSALDWTDGDVASALAEHPELCRDHHVAPDTVQKVARCMAAYADNVTGRDCRPTNERLVVDAQCSLSTVQRARRVLKALGLVVELVAGRSVMTRAERIKAWRRGSAHRRIAATFALCSRPGPRSVHSPRPAAPPAVERDTPPRSPKVSLGSHLGRTHLQRQAETSEKERAPRAAPKSRSRRRPSADPLLRRRIAEAQRVLPWLAGTRAPRLTPLLTPYVAAGWTGWDFALVVRDRMAARGWRVVPTGLKQPAAYLASLLNGVDPAERPSVLEDQLAADEAAHDRLARHGAPCPHGAPGGDVVSPLTGQRGCPLCRAGA